MNESEYQNRLKRLQHAMGLRGLEALLVYSWKRGHVRYLTGYHPNYIANVAMVVVPITGMPALRIRFPFDLERAKGQSWLDDVAASGGLPGLVEDSAALVRDFGYAQGRIGLVTGDSIMDEMPFTLYQQLLSMLPQARFDHVSDILNDLRLVKSPAEFGLLRESARIADAGARAASALMEPGKSEFEVIAAAEAEARKLGAGASLAVITSRPASEHIGPPKDRLLEAGDGVIIEIAVEKAGYWTQVARTFHIGQPTDEQRKIEAAAYQAYRVAIDTCRPGMTCADVAARIRSTLDEYSLGEYVGVDFGHGIGLDLPELPRIESRDSTIIRTGMALVIHPSVQVSGVGGAFIGGTVLIGENAPEPLHAITDIILKGERP